MDKQTNITNEIALLKAYNTKILTHVMYSTYKKKIRQNENTEIGVNYVLYFAIIIKMVYQVI